MGQRVWEEGSVSHTKDILHQVKKKVSIGPTKKKFSYSNYWQLQTHFFNKNKFFLMTKEYKCTIVNTG